MKHPRAILFDHDGVLVASEALHWAAWMRLMTELRIPCEESEIRALVGKTAPEILSAILSRHVPSWSPSEYNLEALALRKNDYFLQKAPAELQAYRGVEAGLRWLKSKGIPAAVVSNAKRRELERALHQLGLISYFQVVVSRDDVSPPKPDPTPYLFAAAQLELDPAECLAVEDSPPGLEAALIGKIPVAAVMTNFPRSALAQPVPGRPDLKPVWIGESIQEFFAWLRSLESRGL